MRAATLRPPLIGSTRTTRLQVDGKYLMTEILVEPVLTLFREEDVVKAERVLQKSEAACLISNSIKSKVIMKPHICVLKEAIQN
jgi:organic hydroperoxide reductase OsmC/OhrA